MAPVGIGNTPVKSTASLKAFAASLRELPRVVSIKVAYASSPVLTEATRATFNAGENAYGLPWEPRSDGSRATLQQSGALARGIRYVATGTKLRVALGVDYAKYQIGRRPVFPGQGGALPSSYVAALSESAREVITAALVAP